MAAGNDDVFEHVRDMHEFHLPGHYHLELPAIFGLQLTRFMVLQAVAVVLVIVVFRGLAKRVQSGEPVRGRWWNFWELLAVFIRDQVVRPAIGTGHHHEEEHAGVYDVGGDHGTYESIETQERHTEPAVHAPALHGAAAVSVGHPADRYLPFVWTVFFYILFNNLLGAIPWLGTATGHISVTATLAVVTFAYVVSSGMAEQGVGNFMRNIAPSMEFPGALGAIIGPPITAMIWLIELAGLLIKHAVLAVRLFANIMAGHTVLAVILSFIAGVAGTGLFWVVTPASIFGQLAIGLLELFIAFLQAYVFALLASLFIGMAVHPH